MSYFLHIIVVYIVFGIGAGIRYVYFLAIGKRRKYDDLIAPNIQGIWNILISLIVVGLFAYLVIKYDTRTTDKKHPPIELLMNKNTK